MPELLHHRLEYGRAALSFLEAVGIGKEVAFELWNVQPDVPEGFPVFGQPQDLLFPRQPLLFQDAGDVAHRRTFGESDLVDDDPPLNDLFQNLPRRGQGQKGVVARLELPAGPGDQTQDLEHPGVGDHPLRFEKLRDASRARPGRNLHLSNLAPSGTGGSQENPEMEERETSRQPRQPRGRQQEVAHRPLEPSESSHRTLLQPGPFSMNRPGEQLGAREHPGLGAAGSGARAGRTLDIGYSEGLGSVPLLPCVGNTAERSVAAGSRSYRKLKQRGHGPAGSGHLWLFQKTTAAISRLFAPSHPCSLAPCRSGFQPRPPASEFHSQARSRIFRGLRPVPSSPALAILLSVLSRLEAAPTES